MRMPHSRCTWSWKMISNSPTSEILKTLHDRRLTLSQRLWEQAAALREEGSPPSSKLEADLRDYLEDFGKCRESLLCSDEERKTPTLSLLIHRHEQLVIAAPLLARLDRLRHLCCRGECDDSALQQVREDAQKTIEAILADPVGPTFQSMRDGLHPLSCLFSILQDDLNLDDESWEQARSQVHETWGIALGTAAVRGRIVLGPDVDDNTLE